MSKLPVIQQQVVSLIIKSRIKMKVIFIISLLMSKVVYSKIDIEGEILAISAKAVKSETVNNKTRVLEDGTLTIVTDTIRVTFKKIRLELGEKSVDLPSKMIFEINTNSEYQLLNAKRVSLLISYIDKNVYKLLDWTVPQKMYCFKEKYIEEKDRYFKADLKDNESMLCRFMKN